MSKMSSLERVIYNILTQENIYFEQEKQFKDLKHGYYRFDFWIPHKNIIVEVHGAQHYKYTKIFHKKRDDFLKAQERDRIKISYCIANNIQLYCIPYWEIDNIKNFKDIINDKFLAKSKYHNDEVWRQQKNKVQ